MSNLLKQIMVWIFLINLTALFCLYDFATDLYPGEKTYPEHVHTTIYISRTFDEFERESIIDAALEWSSTTNHIIEYDIIILPLNKYTVLNMDNSIIISKVDSDDPTTMALDSINKNNTLGYYNKKSIIPQIAIVSDRIENEDYTSVVLHELGHSLGLDHNNGVMGFDTLMYPAQYAYINNVKIRVSSDHITLQDGVNFCKLYHCDATKLKYQKESLHF